MSGEKEKKLFIETYGCQMNVADSEVIASVMKIAGYEPTDAIEDADAVFLTKSKPPSAKSWIDAVSTCRLRLRQIRSF